MGWYSTYRVVLFLLLFLITSCRCEEKNRSKYNCHKQTVNKKVNSFQSCIIHSNDSFLDYARKCLNYKIVSILHRRPNSNFIQLVRASVNHKVKHDIYALVDTVSCRQPVDRPKLVFGHMFHFILHKEKLYSFILNDFHFYFCFFLRFGYEAERSYPAGIYLLKVNNINTRTRCEMCSKLTMKTPERCHWRLFLITGWIVKMWLNLVHCRIYQAISVYQSFFASNKVKFPIFFDKF